MALPKKKKIDFKINKPKPGHEYLNYGMDRINELMLQTDTKSKYLPRTIKFEDIDDAAYEFINSGELQLILDGKKVPVIYLDNDRWGEFSKTWKIADKDKNVPTPYITVRRIEKGKGTRLNNKSRVAQGKLFRYLDVPILDEGQVINLRFKMPEPVNIDLTYEFILFTKFRVDINKFDEILFKTFASTQAYRFINGSPIPILLEGTEEANTIENIDGDRMFIGKYKIKLLGFIQDENDFEIIKTSRKPKFKYDI